MNVRLDTVLDIDSKVLCKGITDDVIRWLIVFGDTRQDEPLWVSVGETGDLITASQYLDLAS